MNWTQAKKDTRETIQSLPEYTHDDIEREYTALLDALKEDDVKNLATNAKTFEMYKRFPTFANSYSGIFNMACRRPNPLPMSVLKELMQTIELQKSGVITEAKAHAKAMDLAESYRRQSSDANESGNLK